MPNDRRIGFFDRLAETWDRDEQEPEEVIRRLEEARDLIGFRRGQALLEVGCGTGQVTGWLVEQVRPGRVVAIDFSEAMLVQARAKGIDAAFERADVCADHLGARLYNIALCFHSFPHFRDQATALRNLGRALKPGGALIVMHLNGRAEVNAFHDSIGGAVEGDHLPDERMWNVMLERTGLQKTELIDREGLYFLRIEAPMNN